MSQISLLDFGQVIRRAYDESANRIRVDATATIIAPSTLEVEINHEEDSVRLGDGTNFLTSTTVGPKVGLDVAIISASDLDIRDLDASQDNVAISDGTNFLTINPDGTINVVEGGGDVQNIYNEVSSVPSGVPTTIVTFTATGDTKLRQVSASGTNVGRYTVLLNGSPIDRQYTTFGAMPNLLFLFDKGLSLVNGDIVALEILHNRPTVGTFNGRITVVA